MESHKPLVFKVAAEDWEFDLIHQLNYKTFVEEIPQHQPSASRRLVDKFHGGIDGHEKIETLDGFRASGGDSDYLPLIVEGWAATVAMSNGHIGLQ